jgi:hypothetical protein
VEDDPDPAIAGSSMQICARAAMGGVDSVVQWRPAVKNGGAVQWWRRGLPVTGSRSGLGFVGGEMRFTVNLVLRAGGPHLYL